MLSNMRRTVLVAVFSVLAGAGSLAWAAHGHGGGHGGGGHSHSGGHGHSGGFSHSGGHGHVSYGHYGGHNGFNNNWGGSRYYGSYHNHGWPYNYYRNYYYRPYAYGYFAYPFLNSFYGGYGYGGYPSSYYYSYPSYYDSYPTDYYVNSDDSYYGDAQLPREYVVGRPVSDVAQVQFRLPDPNATLWVQGKEMTSTGTVRQFKSPQLDPSQQYTYTVKAEWSDNGKLVTDERKVKVQANASAVVDFTQPIQATRDAQMPAMPDLPPPQPRPGVE